MQELFDELKRRDVHGVAVTSAAVAFVGFPVALVLARAFELTPEGGG